MKRVIPPTTVFGIQKQIAEAVMKDKAGWNLVDCEVTGSYNDTRVPAILWTVRLRFVSAGRASRHFVGPAEPLPQSALRAARRKFLEPVSTWWA
jgi:hypothetical protein